MNHCFLSSAFASPSTSANVSQENAGTVFAFGKVTSLDGSSYIWAIRNGLRQNHNQIEASSDKNSWYSGPTSLFATILPMRLVPFLTLI